MSKFYISHNFTNKHPKLHWNWTRLHCKSRVHRQQTDSQKQDWDSNGICSNQ